MAARRGKQARRNSSRGLPSWAWLVIGVALTLVAVLLVPRLLKSPSGDGFLRLGPTPNPDAQPVAARGDTIAPDVASEPAHPAPVEPPKPRYDFYTLLPGEGVQMSDAELAASAKAEAEAQARAAATPAEPANAASAAALPAPLGDTASAAATPPAPAAAATAPKAAADGGSTRYLLQAGAFGASGDAAATKAKIALLGLNARVESAQIDGKTVYRVRMGPYGSASELAEAKAKLAGGGLPAMAVKTN